MFEIKSKSDLAGIDPETLIQFFRRMANKLGQVYRCGIDKWLAQNHPEIIPRIDQLEKELETVWNAAIAGTASLPEYKDALMRLYTANMEAVDMYLKWSENGRNVPNDLGKNQEKK